MFFHSFHCLSDCYLHSLSILSLISSPNPFPTQPYFPSHPLSVIPRLSVPLSPWMYPILTSLPTLVTYFLSGCPENTVTRSQLVSTLLSSLSLSCCRQRGTLIRKLGKMWRRALECFIIQPTHKALFHYSVEYGICCPPLCGGICYNAAVWLLTLTW